MGFSSQVWSFSSEALGFNSRTLAFSPAVSILRFAFALFFGFPVMGFSSLVFVLSSHACFRSAVLGLSLPAPGL